MWSTFLFPIIPCILKIGVIAYALKVSFHISLRYDSTSPANLLDTILKVYNFVACIWAIWFISALTQMTLATTFGTWYWTHKKKDIPPNVLTAALKTSTTYHLGTIAFGSLIITLCRILYGISWLFNRYGPFGCFMSSVTEFLKRFNRDAYIMCAVHGRGLCTSALSAYHLIVRNALRYIALNWTTALIFELSKFLLVVGTGFIADAYYDYKVIDIEDYYYIQVPKIIVVIGAYCIADGFFSVYTMAVDTMVLCFRK